MRGCLAFTLLFFKVESLTAKHNAQSFVNLGEGGICAAQAIFVDLHSVQNLYA